MSTLAQAEGGESDKGRPVFANPADGSMPGQCAAMLAVMARIDPDATRRATYLQHAKYAFQYAQGQSGTVGDAQGNNSFYAPIKTDADGVTDAKLNAAVELWLTTGDNTYKTQAQTYSTTVAFNSYWNMDWQNQAALGVYNAKYVLGATLGSGASKDLATWLSTARSNVDASNNGISKMDPNGFALRGPEGYAFLTALVQAQTKDYSNDQFVLNQIDYMLGANSKNQTYLVGWDEGNKALPTSLHNRNYYMSEDPAAVPGAKAPPSKNKYFGAMVPGALDGSYTAGILNYSMNEACLEQNAPVVAALGYIISRVAPVDTSSLNKVTAVATRQAPGRLTVHEVPGGLEISVPFGQELIDLHAYDLAGREATRLVSGGNSVHWPAPAGTWILRGATREGSVYQAVVPVTR
jgi:hypothetical protein